jgi:hypothetical protein
MILLGAQRRDKMDVLIFGKLIQFNIEKPGRLLRYPRSGRFTLAYTATQKPLDGPTRECLVDLRGGNGPSLIERSEWSIGPQKVFDITDECRWVPNFHDALTYPLKDKTSKAGQFVTGSQSEGPASYLSIDVGGGRIYWLDLADSCATPVMRISTGFLTDQWKIERRQEARDDWTVCLSMPA